MTRFSNAAANVTPPTAFAMASTSTPNTDGNAENRENAARTMPHTTTTDAHAISTKHSRRSHTCQAVMGWPLAPVRAGFFPCVLANAPSS